MLNSRFNILIWTFCSLLTLPGAKLDIGSRILDCLCNTFQVIYFNIWQISPHQLHLVHHIFEMVSLSFASSSFRSITNWLRSNTSNQPLYRNLIPWFRGNKLRGNYGSHCHKEVFTLVITIFEYTKLTLCNLGNTWVNTCRTFSAPLRQFCWFIFSRQVRFLGLCCQLTCQPFNCRFCHGLSLPSLIETALTLELL